MAKPTTRVGRRFTPQLKREAVALVRAGRNVTAASGSESAGARKMPLVFEKRESRSGS